MMGCCARIYEASPSACVAFSRGCAIPGKGSARLPPFRKLAVSCGKQAAVSCQCVHPVADAPLDSFQPQLSSTTAPV